MAVKDLENCRADSASTEGLSSSDISVDSEKPTNKNPEAVEEESLPPQRLVLAVMITMVQGYTLVGPLQHYFKVRMGIADTGDVAHVFTQAAALVQWGKFAMTLGQNVVLSFLSPLERVYLAWAGMFLGCLVPPFLVYALGSTWLGWVCISFGLIGLSLGIFECTFLNVITPLGPLTKSWAIMGFPGAFAIVNVIGMTLVSFGLPVEALFWYIVACLPIGFGIFVTKFVPQLRGPRTPSNPASEEDREETTTTAPRNTNNKQAMVWRSIQQCQKWLPVLLPFMFANIIGHFVMEGALPANFNTFNSKQAPLFSRYAESHLMKTSRFFVVFFLFVGLGDMISRRVGYCFRLSTYPANLVALALGILCSVFGMYLTTIGVGLAAWASAFFAFWGQGFNYAVASKYIDKYIPRDHNLAAYSFWMFAGSAGAIAGSTTVDALRYWICHDETYPHLCLTHGHH